MVATFVLLIFNSQNFYNVLAGKTSILGVLTGDTSPTSGHVYVAGHDVAGEERDGVTKARKNIGFCPQVDPLLDLMTGRETLTMFARLRGIPGDTVAKEVEELLDRLTLTPHADKTAGTYSGGNKRKLSLGIALIADPQVLLIDEASSGLDPVAKRHMWNLISEVSRERSVIISTHSMQEAEALCTRAGIMSSGQLLALGSVQHLKSKYLDGFTIDIICHAEDEKVDALERELLENLLPGARVAERHGYFLRLTVPSLSLLGLGTAFRCLEALKNDPQWQVEQYGISQCTLEQVFLHVMNQESPTTTTELSEIES
jgi:ATP-binding cassette subfamily A (ABC1) protein 3